MKNVNVFVDVDLTLIDAFGAPLPGSVEGVRRLQAAGCHLFCWSTGGANYAESVAQRLGIRDCFEAFIPKPDIVIDDAPASVRAFLDFIPGSPDEWEQMVGRLVTRHLD